MSDPTSDPSSADDDAGQGYVLQRWLVHLEGIDLQIAREAIICGVPLLEAGVIERVLGNDSGVCRHPNPTAFETLRALLIMHFTVRDRAAQDLGETAAQLIGEEIRAHLGSRIGHQLGTRRP